MAKKTRGDASMPAISAPNVDSITTTEMKDAPIRPTSAVMVSAAMSGDCATAPIGLTYR